MQWQTQLLVIENVTYQPCYGVNAVPDDSKTIVLVQAPMVL